MVPQATRHQPVDLEMTGQDWGCKTPSERREGKGDGNAKPLMRTESGHPTPKTVVQKQALTRAGTTRLAPRPY